MRGLGRYCTDLSNRKFLSIIKRVLACVELNIIFFCLSLSTFNITGRIKYYSKKFILIEIKSNEIIFLDDASLWNLSLFKDGNALLWRKCPDSNH